MLLSVLKFHDNLFYIKFNINVVRKFSRNVILRSKPKFDARFSYIFAIRHIILSGFMCSRLYFYICKYRSSIVYYLKTVLYACIYIYVLCIHLMAGVEDYLELGKQAGVQGW